MHPDLYKSLKENRDAGEARRYLYIHGFLTDTQDEKIRARIDEEWDRALTVEYNAPSLDAGI